MPAYATLRWGRAKKIQEGGLLDALATTELTAANAPCARFQDQGQAGKETALLPPPPQRTAQATFTANGSSTAKASSADAGLAVLHKTFANAISLVHLIAETRALNCITAVSSKLPYVEP